MDILTKINTVTSTNEAFVNLQLSDENGVLRNFTLPSITSIKSDIERLNNNINAIYNIDSGGSLVESSNSNKFRKIITVSLNKEPNDIGAIGSIDTFKSKPNFYTHQRFYFIFVLQKLQEIIFDSQFDSQFDSTQ